MSQTAHDDAVRFIHDQHDDIRRLFATVERTSGDQRRDAFEPLVRLLAVHETAEEMVVYPTIRLTDEGRTVAEARLQEEDEAKKLLADLEGLDLSSTEFDQLFAVVRRAVEAHAAAEEREVLPLLERMTDAQQLERIGGALRKAEALAPTHPHKAAPESAVGNLLTGPFVSMVDRVRVTLRDAKR